MKLKQPFISFLRGISWGTGISLVIAVAWVVVLGNAQSVPNTGSEYQHVPTPHEDAPRRISQRLWDDRIRSNSRRLSESDGREVQIGLGDDSSISNIQLVQWQTSMSTDEPWGQPETVGHIGAGNHFEVDWGTPQDMLPSKFMRGIDQHSAPDRREARWRDGGLIPWEQYGYGEFIGPYRTPFVDEYRLRVDDLVELNFIQTRVKTTQRYRLNVGDTIQIISPVDSSLNQPSFLGVNLNGLPIMPDGTVSLVLIGEVRAAGKTVQDLEKELNERYLKFVRDPSIVVQVTQMQTPVQDVLDAVDSRFGQGGRARQATVSPDGTIQLPFIGTVPALGLSLDELGREVNVRLNQRIQGIEVTPILVQRAPRFIYVMGEVAQPGRFEMTGATSTMQAIALAGGFNRVGGNVRQIIVFRRDHQWRLTATKLDLSGAMFGKRPQPSDEIWLRDSDIVLIPPKPIQRFSDAVGLYLGSTLYALFPQQGIVFNFDDFNSL